MHMTIHLTATDRTLPEVTCAFHGHLLTALAENPPDNVTVTCKVDGDEAHVEWGDSTNSYREVWKYRHATGTVDTTDAD